MLDWTNLLRCPVQVARHISKVRRFLEEEDEDQIDLFDVQKHFWCVEFRHQRAAVPLFLEGAFCD